MRLVNVDAKVVVTLYDEEREEHLQKKMTVEEMLNTYTDGCPPVLPSERKTGHWNCSDDMWEYGVCSCCGWDSGYPWEHCLKNLKYCANCGSPMEAGYEQN